METTDAQQTITPQEITAPGASEDDLPTHRKKKRMKAGQNKQKSMRETEPYEAASEVDIALRREERGRSGDKYQPMPPKISDDKHSSRKTSLEIRK